MLLPWLSLLVGSALPLIVWRELTHTAPPVSLLLGQAAVLLALGAATILIPSLRRLRPLVGWLFCLSVGWHVVIGGVTGSALWQEWRQVAAFGAYRFSYQALLAVPTLLLLIAVATGQLGRIGPRDLRLLGGRPGAPAARDLLLLNPRETRWSVLAPALGLCLCLGTCTAMFFVTRPDAAMFARLLPALPVVLAASVLNAVQEEFHFRNGHWLWPGLASAAGCCW